MRPVWLHGRPLDERMWEREVARFGGVAVRLYGRGESIDGWAAQLLVACRAAIRDRPDATGDTDHFINLDDPAGFAAMLETVL